MSRGGSERVRVDLDQRGDSHYEAADKSVFPTDVANALKAALEARGLSPEQAAEEIGIPSKTVIHISRGGSPKGARKVNAWLAAGDKEEGSEQE
jgi:hypothetical protein